MCIENVILLDLNVRMTGAEKPLHLIKQRQNIVIKLQVRCRVKITAALSKKWHLIFERHVNRAVRLSEIQFLSEFFDCFCGKSKHINKCTEWCTQKPCFHCFKVSTKYDCRELRMQ